MELIVRFYYGSIMPWVQRESQRASSGRAGIAHGIENMLIATAGPDALCLRATVDLRQEQKTITADFAMSAGDTIPFVLTS